MPPAPLLGSRTDTVTPEMREVPYYTTDDESQWCGHIWRHYEHLGGRWGFCWEVMEPHSCATVAGGWRETQEAAEKAMNESLAGKLVVKS